MTIFTSKKVSEDPVTPINPIVLKRYGFNHKIKNDRDVYTIISRDLTHISLTQFLDKSWFCQIFDLATDRFGEKCKALETFEDFNVFMKKWNVNFQIITKTIENKIIESKTAFLRYKDALKFILDNNIGNSCSFIEIPFNFKNKIQIESGKEKIPKNFKYTKEFLKISVKESDYNLEELLNKVNFKYNFSKRISTLNEITEIDYFVRLK